jgi:hypothetical protein
MRPTAIVLLCLVTGAPMAWGAGTTGNNDLPLPPDAPAASDIQAPDDQPLSADTPIERLAGNPGAVAILDSNLPGLLEDSNYAMFKSMSLKTVASLSGGRIPADTVKDVDTQLKAMPIMTAAVH